MKHRKICINQKYGDLTVVEYLGVSNFKGRWLCRCDCGNFTEVTTSLIGKRVISCGCIKKQPRKKQPRKYYAGQSFGNWTVLKYVARSRYICRCVCGTEKEICSNEFKKGEPISCGCISYTCKRDLTGKTFGRLTALKYLRKSNARDPIWQCRCICGNLVEVVSGSLHKGHTASCGCIRIDRLKARTPEQLYEHYVKAAKTANRSYIRYHWKTNQELVCRGSWEPKVVDYLNEKNINFNWQIPINLPNGRLYIVDLYLPDQDIWVEIKGYSRESFQKKWIVFQEMYPNSVIWDKDILVQMGVL